MSGAVLLAFALVVASVAGCSRSNQITAPGPSVTLTGCLHPGTAPDTYFLTSEGTPSGPVGTRGVGQLSTQQNPTGTAAGSRTADEGAFDTRLYQVVGGKSVDLAVYQGALVKLTGRIEGKANASNKPTSGRNPATGEGPETSVERSPDRPLQVLRVERVQRVQATCGPVQ